MTELRVPAHLQPYVDALGVDLAIEFFANFGGTEVYLGATPTERSELVRILGMDAACALGALAASRHLPARVPLGKPWVAQVLSQRGLSQAEIARRLHTTDVTVRKYLKGDRRDADELAADLRQYRLF